MSGPPHRGTHLSNETRNKIIESNIRIQGVTMVLIGIIMVMLVPGQ